MKTNLLIAATAATLALLGSTAFAAETNSQTMTVSATVTRTCTIVVGNIGFVIGTANGDTKTAALTVTCSAGSANDAPTVALGLSANAEGAQRRMLGGEGGAQYIPYSLVASTLTLIGGGPNYTSTITGTVPAGAYGLGTYTDTATVQVTYSDVAVQPVG